jgi:peptide-methionine (R)-S-oxide reductase
MMEKEQDLPRSEAEWRQKLDDESYRVLRQAGTERPWSSSLNEESRDGIYKCKGCGQPLYDSAAKFDSGCGWPSFDTPATRGAVTEHLDKSHGMIRTEMRCGGCGSHLGHIFPDGPTSTGMRHCVNGICLVFEPEP